MSAYVDKILQPSHPKMSSYIQDNTQFLNCISRIKSVPHNALTVSMDVRAWYSSIPHSDDIEAFEIFMIENGFSSIEISNITKIMDFILAHNYFEFNDASYIHTAMKKIWPPHMQAYLCGTLRIFTG